MTRKTMLMRKAGPLTLTLLLTACTFQFPVVGRLSTGEALQGQIEVDTSGAGRFAVYAPNGIGCVGVYDGFADQPTLTLPLTCSDGQGGEVIATRDDSGIRGTAVARLDDGTTGELIFGDITAAEQAAFLTATARTAGRTPEQRDLTERASLFCVNAGPTGSWQSRRCILRAAAGAVALQSDQADRVDDRRAADCDAQWRNDLYNNALCRGLDVLDADPDTALGVPQTVQNQIMDQCEADWPGNFSMIALCVRDQAESWRALYGG